MADQSSEATSGTKSYVPDRSVIPNENVTLSSPSVVPSTRDNVSQDVSETREAVMTDNDMDAVTRVVQVYKETRRHSFGILLHIQHMVNSLQQDHVGLEVTGLGEHRTEVNAALDILEHLKRIIQEKSDLVEQDCLQHGIPREQLENYHDIFDDDDDYRFPEAGGSLDPDPLDEDLLLAPHLPASQSAYASGSIGEAPSMLSAREDQLIEEIIAESVKPARIGEWMDSMDKMSISTRQS